MMISIIVVCSGDGPRGKLKTQVYKGPGIRGIFISFQAYEQHSSYSTIKNIQQYSSFNYSYFQDEVLRHSHSFRCPCYYGEREPYAANRGG